MSLRRAGAAQAAHEQCHRYLWARELAAGRSALLVGGEEPGAELLERGASSVVAVDGGAGVVERLRALDDGCVDVAVAFDVLERADREPVLEEVRRVLASGGLLVVAAEDRAACEEALGTRFGEVRVYEQRPVAGSRVETVAGQRTGGHLGLTVDRADDGWEEVAASPPSGLIAIAGEAAALASLPDDSTLADAGFAERHAEELAELVAEVSLHRRDAELRLQELEYTRQRLARVDGSVAWKIFQRVSAKAYAAIGGRDSRAGRLLSGAMRRLGSRGRQVATRRSWRTIEVPRFPSVEASIVIPVHSGAELTERCLRSVVAAAGAVPYEVILVDDAADADTKALLDAVEGVRVVVNPRNEGYLRSTNRGAAEARGRHVVLLNNDTEPQVGWLDALVERAESAPDVGVVAAKLIYPDGALQEAGGIVWRDGVPWNFGNGNRADLPEFNYAREVDYGSAAALLVRAELWRAAGGFDERFAPGYFEDTDLCFTARALGWRVMYEPRAVVIHKEGGSMGTDLASGGKRHQELNQPKFAAKWSEALREQPDGRSLERAYAASDHRRGPQVLIVDHRLPTPDRDSGSLRMWGMVEALLALGCRVAFLPDNSHGEEPYATRLRALGVEVLDGAVVVPERFAALGDRLELIVLSRPYVAARYVHLAREFAPSAKLAYDTVDLHYLRERRRIEHAAGDDLRVAEAFEHLELALARSADVTLVVSDQERRHLLEVAPELAVEIVPNVNRVPDAVPGPERRSGLMFVGGFEHTPNVDAVLYLVHEVMPLVRRSLPDVELTVVGGNAPPEIDRLDEPGVRIAGWVEDLEPLLRGSVALVAPLRYGAGMKGKVTQSLAAGLPVVTTSIGAEGLQAQDGRELLIADDAAGIAERIVSLHRDDEQWRALSAAGRELAERICSPRVQEEAMRRLLGIDAREAGRLAATGAR